jgi:glycosyltransferase involved in cell wall biosynthesis
MGTLSSPITDTCGITGFLSPGGFSFFDANATLSKMRDLLVHRGPDDAGSWLDAEAGIALGHRRLSIVDLSPAGHQPMVSPSGRYIVVFNGEIYNHLDLRAASLDMPGVVRDPERWMARCAFYVLPSRYEGFPNALLEAMAMGCPVIAADCDSGPSELIRHGENGLMVPVEDVEALAQAMQSLVSDHELRMDLGSAVGAVREQYSRAVIVNEWRKVMVEAIRE